MSLVRLVARPLLASLFVWAGVKTLMRPDPQVAKSEPVAERIKPALQKAPVQLPTDTKTLVMINAGVHVAGGTMLALGFFPRVAALVLAGSMVPTTVAGHPFWEYDDPAQRNNQTTHFLKNVSITGGLLIAAADTQGRPGLAWRAKHASTDAKRAAKMARREAALATKAARAEVSRKAHDLVR